MGLRAKFSLAVAGAVALWGIEADQVDRIARPEKSLDARVLDPARALGVGAWNPTSGWRPATVGGRVR